MHPERAEQEGQRKVALNSPSSVCFCIFLHGGRVIYGLAASQQPLLLASHAYRRSISAAQRTYFEKADSSSVYFSRQVTRAAADMYHRPARLYLYVLYRSNRAELGHLGPFFLSS